MTQSAEVVKSVFNDEWMAKTVRAEGANLNDIAAAFNLDGVNVMDDAGDGVYNTELIEDKEFLNGLPFLITRWRFNTSEDYMDSEGNPGVFVSVEIAYQLTPQSPVQTGVFNDGSTGICAQLKSITENREKRIAEKGEGNDPHAGRFVRHGLRRSDYRIPVLGKDGQPLIKDGVQVTEAATTYYLNI